MSWRQLACAVAMSIAVTASGISYADGPHGPMGPGGPGGPPGPPGPPGAIDQSLVQRGFEISPIPKDKLNFKGKDPYLVGLGAYLVNAAADCNGCHSFPRFLGPGVTSVSVNGAASNPAYGDPYSGPPPDQSLAGDPLKANFNLKHFLAGGRCFGPFMSYNITPDASGRPLGLTEAEFFRVMRLGEDVHCETDHDPSDKICSIGPDTAVLQTMSWPTYHSMTDTDIKAVYAYLSAIPPATACNTPQDGCPSYTSGGKQLYQYNLDNTDPTCPNPPPPQ
jgi:hypothetical protein